METLTNRQKIVLQRIVRQYVDSAVPVGSNHLVQQYQMKWSSATIRAEMASLESLGYIEQPHTSAGRIPTDKAYRFYVNHIALSNKSRFDERETIKENIENAGGDISTILSETSKILSTISKELSVVLTPWMSWGIFDRLELIKLSHHKVLIVIRVRSRSVKTVIIESRSDIKTGHLEKIAGILNERLSGLTLEEIRNTIKDRVKPFRDEDMSFLQQVAESANDLFHFAEPVTVHTCGAGNILKQPEFSDIEMLERLFAIIDDRESLLKLFDRKTGGVEVIIGRENSMEYLNRFTVVKASYHRGKDIGTFGIIGPTRMPYHQILPLVDYVAKSVSHCLS